MAPIFVTLDVLNADKSRLVKLGQLKNITNIVVTADVSVDPTVNSVKLLHP